MFRFPYAIRHYYFHKGWEYAARKAQEFASKPMTRQELEWWINYCRRIPFAWQE